MTKAYKHLSMSGESDYVLHIPVKGVYEVLYHGETCRLLHRLACGANMGSTALADALKPIWVTTYRRSTRSDWQSSGYRFKVGGSDTKASRPAAKISL